MYRRAVPPIRNLLSRAACKRFWEEATLDALLAMTEDDIATRLTSLAAEYSSDGIAITICGERIHFEHTEESGGM